MGMRLTVLGSSGGYPAPGNPSSGFFLEHGAAKLWIDAGNGTFAELQRLAHFTGIDALVLSHVHADHCADVFPLHVAIRYGEHAGLRLPLYCPPGVRETLAKLLVRPTARVDLLEMQFGLGMNLLHRLAGQHGVGRAKHCVAVDDRLECAP